MGKLTEEEFKTVWEEQGLKYRVREFFSFCVSRGVQGISSENFCGKVQTFLKASLVEGQVTEPAHKKNAQVPGWWKQ